MMKGPGMTDHDLLIEIRTTVTEIKRSLESAEFPARCATHEQEHRSHNSRLRNLETRLWAVVMVVIGAIITGRSLF